MRLYDSEAHVVQMMLSVLIFTNPMKQSDVSKRVCVRMAEGIEKNPFLSEEVRSMLLQRIR